MRIQLSALKLDEKEIFKSLKWYLLLSIKVLFTFTCNEFTVTAFKQMNKHLKFLF
jgi:hypothetical protein